METKIDKLNYRKKLNKNQFNIYYHLSRVAIGYLRANARQHDD